MKKMLVFAAMAMMTALASAVTINWTATISPKDSDNPSFGSWCGIAVIKGHVDTSAIGTTVYNKLLTWAETGSNSSYSAVTDYTLLASLPVNANGSVYDQVQGTAVTNGISYAGALNLVQSSDIVLDGDTSVGKFAIVAFNKYNNNGTYSVVNVTITNWNKLAVDEIDIGDVGELNVSKTGDSHSYSTPLPEPTALALLALGVAGLALKRKVK